MKRPVDETRRSLRTPVGFAWAIPYPIWRRGAGSYVAGIAPASLMVATTHGPYYVSTTGSDANDGLSVGAPKRSLRHTLGIIAGPATIYVAAGTYDWTYGWHNVNPVYDCNVIATGGRMRNAIAELNLVWTSTGGGTPNTYSATLAYTSYAVIDETSLTADGLATRLTLQSSVATVDAAPGSYWISAGTVYVRTFDSRAPDASVHTLHDFINGAVTTSARKLYVEGLDFIGGTAAFVASDGDRLVFNDCTFRYGKAGGLSVASVNDCYAFSSYADENVTDGFAYTTTSRALEVGCTARKNGYDGGDINNGSTMHSGGSVVRIGGTYTGNEGPNVADVNDSYSWNLGCTVAGTKATTAGQKVNFYADGLMWLNECAITSTDITDDLYAKDAPDYVRVFNTAYTTTGGSGVVEAFKP